MTHITHHFHMQAKANYRVYLNNGRQIDLAAVSQGYSFPPNDRSQFTGIQFYGEHGTVLADFRAAIVLGFVKLDAVVKDVPLADCPISAVVVGKV